MQVAHGQGLRMETPAAGTTVPKRVATSPTLLVAVVKHQRDSVCRCCCDDDDAQSTSRLFGCRQQERLLVRWEYHATFGAVLKVVCEVVEHSLPLFAADYVRVGLPWEQLLPLLERKERRMMTRSEQNDYGIGYPLQRLHAFAP